MLRRLQLMLDPFPDLRLSHPRQLQDFTNTNNDLQQQKIKAILRRAINYLDLAYTETLEGVLKTHTEKFSQLYSALKARKQEQPESQKIMQFFASNDEAFSSGFNPYQILTARLTTAHVVQFHENLKEVLKNLKTTNLSLMLTQLGIFDFHNLTIGEQKLIGLLYSKCDSGHLNSNLSKIAAELRQDLDFVESEIIEKFDLAECPAKTSYLSDIVSYETLRKNFLRLKLARAFYWLERSFPVFDASLKSLRRYHDLISRGEGFSKSDISEEKAAQLKAEIQKAFELSQFSRDELDRYRILTQYLSSYMELATEAGWKKMHDRVELKLRDINEIMEMQKIYETVSHDDLQDDIFNSSLSLRSQLAAHQKRCEDDCQRDSKPANMVCRVTLPIEKLTAFGQSFSVNSACMNKSLYLWRQPSDSLAPFTVLSHEPTPKNPRPFTRLEFFNVSRKFELMPFGLSDNIEFDRKLEQTQGLRKKENKGFFDNLFNWSGK